MGDLFLKVLNMSITAGWLILAVLCIRLLFRKIPKWVNCLLWGVVAVRLICPFSIESRFSMMPGTEPIKTSTVVEGEVQNYIPSIDSRLTIVKNTINPMLTEAFAYNKSDSVAPLQAVTYAAGLVWSCGVILLLLCAMGSVIKLHVLVGEAVCVRDNIYICDAVKSPFILRLVRPRVYLPSALSDREMDYILAHESAHLKRKDHWWKAFGYLLLCIYWFNPLCWIAYSLLCKDIELACDEKVVRDMTFHEKKEYSRVLLSCAGQGSLIMVCPLAFGEVGVKERVKSVLNYKKPTLWISIAAAAVFVMVAVCFLTNPAKEYQISNVDVGIAAAGNQPESQEIGMISGEEAGEILQRYLSSAGQWNDDYKIEPFNPVVGTIGDNIRAYRFELRYQDTVEQVSDRLIGNYAVTDDGNIYWYDSANDVFIMLQDVSQGIDEEMLTKKDSMQDIMLYEQPEPDKVCIKVQPSVIRENPYYYYIPADKDQEWLSAQIEALDLEGKPFDRRWEGHKERGWQIIYNGMEIRAFEGGYLYYTYDDENGIMECLIEAPRLCDYIQIMLMEKAGYQNYDVSKIKDIVSAKLDVKSVFTGGQFYSQTITDAEILRKFEDWFSNAQYIYGGTECGTQCACLELTLANGDVVRLSMATDSCPNFHIDGVAYDYRPVSDWDNSGFYKCFNEIPWEYE